jgi:gluconokinase
VLRTLQVDLQALQQHLLDPATANHGLTVLPFIAGERCPGWAGDVRATITGISTVTSALNIARAGLEG